MTMKTFREQQRAERRAYVERLILEAGSVRQAAKRADMDRANFQALRRTLLEKTRNLTTPAAAHKG